MCACVTSCEVLHAVVALNVAGNVTNAPVLSHLSYLFLLQAIEREIRRVMLSANMSYGWSYASAAYHTPCPLSAWKQLTYNAAFCARLAERQIDLAVVISTPEQLEVQLTFQLAAGFLQAIWLKQTTQLLKGSRYTL